MNEYETELSQKELDDLWETVGPFCPPNITKEQFIAGTILIMSLKTAEDFDAMVQAVHESKR